MTTTFEPLTKNEIRAHAAHYENENPAIYLGTYHKYNCGSLYGMWIDLTTFSTYDEFCEFCRRLHRDEYEPEFMTQDFEHYPQVWYHEGGIPTRSEYERINKYAVLDEDKREAYEIFLDNYDEDAEIEDFESRYEGKYESGEDFAEHLCEECGYFNSLPQWLQCCIDYGAVWRTLDTGGNYSEFNGHIFNI